MIRLHLKTKRNEEMNPTHGRENMITKTVQVLMCVVLLLWLPAMAVAVNVGDKAPLFTAESTEGSVSLEEYLGKKNVVLALYFAVFTPV
jgi:hypothetical protein